MSYNNCILGHLVANKGTINYCVCWDSSSTKLTKDIAMKLQPMLTHCWPYDEIKVNIVGFAAKKASELGWSDNSMGKIYFCDLDKDGSPQCPRTAIDRRMDRPEDDPSPAGLGGGWGIYWGQQVNLDDMLEHLDDGELEIVSHEMGDGFGLPDFY
ncbi:hypothetical protein PC119_g16138 [Phytophthora cactorum]|nr:hypothetical protein PC119_g16138 [Phytophthora cactorum]